MDPAGAPHSFNRIDIRASYDFKLSDSVFARVSGVAKKRDGYRPRDVLERDRELAHAIDLMRSGLFSRGDRGLYAPLLDDHTFELTVPELSADGHSGPVLIALPELERVGRVVVGAVRALPSTGMLGAPLRLDSTLNWSPAMTARWRAR